MTDDAADSFRRTALKYHEEPIPGKLEIRATKPMASQRDLALAYSPGVAEACLEIKADPSAAAKYTARGNLVAVVSNGSAALGLGDIGGLASKPIMEGKAVLFKKFAGVDCFDIEVNAKTAQEIADVVIALEPTFGAINLEDIKSPECFEVERICQERMNIPVFHDDQHGTAIVVGAGATSAMKVTGKNFEDIKVVSTGGGAAGIACLNQLLLLGVKRENVYLCDLQGLVYEGRTEDMTPQKAEYAQPGGPRSLDDVIEGADLFLGLSGPGVLKPEMVKKMAENPVIFALANPTPEIMPDVAKEVRPDVIMATGRSDFPNQINNVLCFPFIFRGALDVGASEINDEMKIACVNAISALAHASSSAEAAKAYQGERLVFGPEYLIPKAFDPRLLAEVASAVAFAAMDSGVATRPLESREAYKDALSRKVFRSGFFMKPVFEAARAAARRIVFAEGEDERVLRAANAMMEEGVDIPILIGRPTVIEDRCVKFGLPIRPGRDFAVCDPHDDPRYPDYWREYHSVMERRGVTPDIARAVARTNTTAIAALMVRRGEADALVCGTFGQYHWHLNYIDQLLGDGKRAAVGALSAIILESGPVFLADTHVIDEPSPEQIFRICTAATRHVRKFGIEPKLALLSHSSFGNRSTESSHKMREAVRLLDEAKVDFVYEGEMHADAALDPSICERVFPNSRLKGPANVLIFPNVDAASASRNVLKTLAGGLEVGPILMGHDNRAHIVTPSITARGILNVAAIAGVPHQTG